MMSNLYAFIIHTWMRCIRRPTWCTHWHPKYCTHPCVTAMEWSSSSIQSAKVFYLASRILEGKAPPALLTVAQATVDPSTTEDPKKAARRRARLAAEAIASFDAHALDIRERNLFLRCSCSICSRASQHSPLRCAYGNDSGILVVS